MEYIKKETRKKLVMFKENQFYVMIISLKKF